VCAVDFSEPSQAALHVIDVPPELRTPPQPPDYDIGLIRAKTEADCLTRLGIDSGAGA